MSTAKTLRALITKRLLGVLVPQSVHSVVRIESEAEFIIVVEKDTIFQKLLDENFCRHIPISFISITVSLSFNHFHPDSKRLFQGKGYPDANTRLFLNRLYAVLKVPVFILVDANPFGVDIMLTYKLGCVVNRILPTFQSKKLNVAF